MSGTSSPDYTGRAEAMWDPAAWVRQGRGYIAYAAQSPTAIAAAVWQVKPPGPGAWLYGLDFSTDTAISCVAWYAAAALAPAGGTTMLIDGSLITGVGTLYTGLIAPAAPTYIFQQGYVSAGSFTDIMRGRFLWASSAQYLTLQTAAVAANCTATFWMINASE